MGLFVISGTWRVSGEWEDWTSVRVRVLHSDFRDDKGQSSCNDAGDIFGIREHGIGGLCTKVMGNVSILPEGHTANGTGGNGI